MGHTPQIGDICALHARLPNAENVRTCVDEAQHAYDAAVGLAGPSCALHYAVGCLHHSARLAAQTAEDGEQVCGTPFPLCAIHWATRTRCRRGGEWAIPK